MHLSLRKYFIIVSSLVFLVVCGYFFWYLGEVIKVRQPSFTAFYTAFTIMGFDTTKSPRGYFEVYRVDGLYGAPEKIYTSSADQTLATQVEQNTTSLSITNYAVKSNTSTIDVAPIGSITKIDSHGKVLSVQASDKLSSGEYSNIATKQSPDGKFLLTSELSCAKVTTDGPCPTTFSLRIFDTSNFVSKEINPKDFGLNDGGAMKADVLDYVSPTVALVLINDAQELYRQILGRLDLTTGKVDVIWKNLISATETTGRTFQFQWLQPDKVSMIAIERSNVQDIILDRFVSVNLQTLAVTAISDSIKGYSAILTKNLRGYFYSQSFNQGEWFHDIANNRDERITPNGEITDFHIDNRFVPITLFRNSNGNGPKTYSIYDRRTKQNRVVFEQTVAPWGELLNANGPDTTAAHVGDVIYSYIGIDQ